MNILHFADAHIGVTRFGHYDRHTGMNTRIQDFLRSLDFIADYAIKNEIDLILFAGDAFHKRNPKSEYQIAFANRIVEMAAKCCPVVLLVGNHDTGYNLRASSLGVYNMFATNVKVGDSYKVTKFLLNCGPIQIATFPHPVGRLNYQKQREAALEKLVELENAIDEDIPSILLAHMTVESARYGSEQRAAFSEEFLVSIEDLIAGPWNYVALGHLHSHQNLNARDNPAVVYAGSIERVDMSESEEKKGFVHIVIEGFKTTWKFVELPVRPMHYLKADLMNRLNKDYTDYVLSIIEDYGDIFDDAIVRVRLKIKDTDRILVDERLIAKALCSASDVSFMFDIQYHERKVRLGTSPHTLTTGELIEKYFIDRIEDPTERAHLLKVAKELMAEVDDDQLDTD